MSSSGVLQSPPVANPDRSVVVQTDSETVKRIYCEFNGVQGAIADDLHRHLVYDTEGNVEDFRAALTRFAASSMPILKSQGSKFEKPKPTEAVLRVRDWNSIFYYAAATAAEKLHPDYLTVDEARNYAEIKAEAAQLVELLSVAEQIGPLSETSDELLGVTFEVGEVS